MNMQQYINYLGHFPTQRYEHSPTKGNTAWKHNTHTQPQAHRITNDIRTNYLATLLWSTHTWI